MCDCVSKINQKLEEGGYNTVIDTPLTLNPDLSNQGNKLKIATAKLDNKKRGRPVPIFSSYCPFCGEKH